MTIAATDSRMADAPAVRLDAVPLWAWWLLALIAMTGLALLVKGVGRAFEFIDSDDALRLVHVRELLAGAPWLEVTTKALGGADGLVSHWSRLIDGPMAALLGLLRLVLPERVAQNIVVTLWPALMLGGVLWAIARATLEACGRAVALYALAFAATSVLAYYQFAPGRIDHHNAMIAATVSAAMLMWAWPQSARIWLWSGLLCGLALAIGYEALAPVFVIAILAAGWGLLDPQQARPSAVFVTGLVAALAGAFVATVAPARWLTIHCDALSLNIVVLAVLAGGGFVLVTTRAATWSWMPRLAVLAISGGAGVAAFAALEPVCLGGPMAQVPQALWPIWIGQVEEAKSLLAELVAGPIAGPIGPVTVFGVGVVALFGGMASSRRRADRFLLAVALGFVALALWQMKYLAYAGLLLAPGMAYFVARLPAFGEIRAPFVRVVAFVLLNQLAVLSLALPLTNLILSAAARPQTEPQSSTGSPQLACTRAADLAVLDSAPAGLVVTHNDIGAHLAAATRHTALSGPYHRIPDAILANFDILSARETTAAGRALARQGADYVLTCAVMDAAQIARPGWSGSLLAGLAAGQAPEFLVAVELGQETPFRLWRVDRSQLPPP